MNKKQMSINMLANVVSFTVSFGINFLFTPYLIKTIGKEAYGFYPLANNFTSYAQLIVMALNSMASRFITIRIVNEEYKDAKEYFSSVFFGNIFIAAILSALSIFFIYNINNFLKVPENLLSDVTMLFILVFISMILSVIISVFGIATFAKNRIDLRSYQEISLSLIKVASLGFMFYFFKPSVSFIGAANLIVVLLTFAFTYAYTKKLLPKMKISVKDFRFKTIKILIESGIWNSFNQLSAVLLSGLDLLIANTVLGASIAAEYGIAQTAPTFIGTLAAMIVGVFAPHLTIVYANKNREEFTSEIMKVIKVTNVIVNIPITFLISFGDVFFKLWVPGEDSRKLYILSLMILVPLIVIGTLNVLFNVCTTLNKVKIPSIVVFITGIVNVIAVLTLLKNTNIGVYAIPLSSGILSLTRYLIFTTTYTAKAIGIKWHAFYKSIFKALLSMSVMVLIGFIMKSSFAVHSWFAFIIVGMIFSVIALVLNVLVIFNKEEIKQGKGILALRKGKFN